MTDQRDQILIAGPGGGRQEGDRLIDPEAGLLADLGAAEDANMFARPCQVCSAIESMSGDARGAVIRALGGTIGERTLADILTRNGYPTGRRAVARHRLEGHS